MKNLKYFYLISMMLSINNLSSMLKVKNEQEVIGVINDCDIIEKYCENEILESFIFINNPDYSLIFEKKREDQIEREFVKIINDWNNLFEKAPEIDLNLDKESLELLNELKEKRFNDLLKALKNESLKKYENISKTELNNKLIKKLNKFPFFKEKLIKIVELILAGANINSRDNHGRVALIMAVLLDYDEIVEILIKLGANVNIQDNFGNTCLMKAVFFGQKKIVEMLINAGADISIKDNFGRTVLMITNNYGDKEMTELIKNKNISVNIKNVFVNSESIDFFKNSYSDSVN